MRRLGYIPVLALALIALGAPGAALAAKPVAVFHDRFTFSFTIEAPDNFCGIAPVDGTIVGSQNFFEYADGSFKGTGSTRQTFTNPANGHSVLVSGAGQTTGTALVDEQAGTITFVYSFKGLPEKIQTAHGPVLTRDAGIITFADTFDLDTFDFLGSEVTVNKGPHPDADSDFALFCQVILAALS